MSKSPSNGVQRGSDTTPSVKRKSLSIGDIIYACTDAVSTIKTPWKKAKIKGIRKVNEAFIFLMSFLEDPEKIVDLKGSRIAFSTATNAILRVGTRIVAPFKPDPESTAMPIMMAGVVAEPPSPLNKYRYLIFFDASPELSCFVQSSDIYLIVDSGKYLIDLPSPLKEFIQPYMKKFPERYMLKFLKGDEVKINVASSGVDWQLAKVIDTDCSLAKFNFSQLNQDEWIYRGSIRLLPIFMKLHDELPKSVDAVAESPVVDKAKPIIVAKSRSTQDTTSEKLAVETNGTEEKILPKIQNARKSLPAVAMEQAPITFAPTKPMMFTFGRPSRLQTKSQVYTPHQCSSECVVDATEKLILYKSFLNPFEIPLLAGFDRQLARLRAVQMSPPNESSHFSHQIFYVAKCGRRFRNFDDIALFLRETGSNLLSIDMFSFDKNLTLYADNILPTSILVRSYIDDVTGGSERTKISCINTVDDVVFGTNFKYIKSRILTDDVKINPDKGFLICCDCEDNCSDLKKCQCHILTRQSAIPDSTVEYEFGRLNKMVQPGIYECNQNCKCRASCDNRVVQRGVVVQLQIFRTLRRGWGVRCLHDIPRGTFVSTYVGQLISSRTIQKSSGDTYSDEFLAALDCIECCEKLKEGYESSVSEMTESDTDCDDENQPRNEADVDKDFTSRVRPNGEERRTSKRRRKKPSDADKPKSLRKIFDEKTSYSIDARCYGNVGRFFNHSCEPNMFVQNVFIGTHDLRFPHVAFFTAKNIAAGSELTWNYAYDIGSIPGRELPCHCLSLNCRRRLL